MEVYDAHAHSVALELDGREVARARVRDFAAVMNVAYQPGTLTARALDKRGRELSRSSLTSAQGALRLDAQQENPVKAGDIAYVPINIVGENGQVESNADERLTVQVSDGTLLGFGSPQPAPTESFLDGAYTTYRGRTLAIVHRETPGRATLSVKGETLAPAAIDIEFL